MRRDRQPLPGPAAALVNDFLFQDSLTDDPLPAARQGDTVVKEYTIDARHFRPGKNTLFAQVYSKAYVRGDGSTRVVLCDKLETPGAKPRLFGRFFGVGTLPKTDLIKFKTLKADADADVFVDAWKSQASKAFVSVDATSVVNADATPARILQEIKSLGEMARPEDVVIISLSGHGALKTFFEQAIQKNATLAAQTLGPDSLVFIAGGFDPTRIAETTLGFETLQHALERINARKIVLLDTCHSGDAVSTADDPRANPIRVLAEHGVGCAIFAACGPNETAQEDQSGGSDLDSEARGLFTLAWGRHLTGHLVAFPHADSGSVKDSALNASELNVGLVDQMKSIFEKAELAKKGVPPQNPDIFIPSSMKRLRLVVQ